MIAILSKQQDFVNDAEITQIKLIAHKYNEYSKVFHFPKFHCELNEIENVQMDIKNNYRSQQDFENKRNSKVNEIINKLLDSIPIDRIKKCTSNSILYCHLHAGGVADGEIAEKVK